MSHRHTSCRDSRHAPRARRLRRLLHPRRLLPRAAILAILLGLIAGGPVLASTGDDLLEPVDLERLIAEAPGAADLPEADAVDLYWATIWQVDGNGRVVRREHIIRKLLTPWAVRNLSDRRVAWDSARQDLHIPVCRTFMRDGTEVTTPPRGRNEVTPDAVAHAADFLDLREMVISHVGTEPGCVTELIYETVDREAPPLPASVRLPLAERHPVRDRRIVVVARAEVTHALLAAGNLPTVTVENRTGADGPRLHCRATNIAAVPPEGGWPDRLDVVPHLVVGTAPAWKHVTSKWRRLGNAALADTVGIARWLTDATNVNQGEDDDLPADLSPLASVRRVSSIVGERLGTIHLPTGLWSRPPRTVADVLASGAATPWEKGIVAQALLAAADATAEIGFFTPGQSFAAEVPAAASFAHVRVVLAIAGENWWISPDRANPFTGRCDLPGRSGLFLETGTSGHRIYRVIATPATAMLAAIVRPAGDDDSERPWLAEIEFSATGTFWPAGESGDDVAAKLAAAVLPGGEVESVEEQVVGGGRGRLRMTARAPALEAAATGTFQLTVPAGVVELAAALDHAPITTTAPRRTPLFVQQPLDWQVRLRLEMPDSLIADYWPPAGEREAAGARFARESHGEGRICEIRCRLEVPIGPVAAAEVPAWRETLREPLLPAGSVVVLRRP